MIRQALLPSNATPMEVAISESLDRLPELFSEFDKARRHNLYANPLALPAIIAGSGLSEITQYISPITNVMALGTAWQRVRGTPKAIELGLAWISYIASLEETEVHRRKWHAVQLRFPSLPSNDSPDLLSISNITKLSLPARSYLRRGVHKYDIPATATDRRHLDSSHLDRSSGANIPESAAIWSFGRSHEFVHNYTETDGLSIGNWLPAPNASAPWVQAEYPWPTAEVPWVASGAVARRTTLSSWFSGKVIYLCLRDSAGEVIGYRRCRVSCQVAHAANGRYLVAGYKYSASSAGYNAYIEAMTDFGNAQGATAKTCSLIANAILTAGVKAGKLWLAPNELQSGDEFAHRAISTPLRKTVRDQFKYLLRF